MEKNEMGYSDLLVRIGELEMIIETQQKLIEKQQEELEKYRGKKESGRKPHNDAWISGYEKFVKFTEENPGANMPVAAKELGISERTAYRYKEYQRYMRLAAYAEQLQKSGVTKEEK